MSGELQCVPVEQQNGYSVAIVMFQKDGDRGPCAWHGNRKKIVVDRNAQSLPPTGKWVPVNLFEHETCFVATPIVVTSITKQASRLNALEKKLQEMAEGLDQERRALEEEKENAERRAWQLMVETREEIAQLRMDEETGRLLAEKKALEAYRERLVNLRENLEEAVSSLTDAQEEVRQAGGFSSLILPSRIPQLPPSPFNGKPHSPGNGDQTQPAHHGKTERKPYRIAV